MKVEVAAAVNFITSFLKLTGRLCEEQLEQFSSTLEKTLGEHYEAHWFPDAPFRGSGYRCIRINHKMDPLVGKAARTTGFSWELFLSLLPRELTVWVDPYEVSYRIGESGSICVLYESTPLPETHLDFLNSCKNPVRIKNSRPSGSFTVGTVCS